MIAPRDRNPQENSKRLEDRYLGGDYGSKEARPTSPSKRNVHCTGNRVATAAALPLGRAAAQLRSVSRCALAGALAEAA